MEAAAPTSPRQQAPIVFEDGIGERMSAVGGANESLEVLKVSNELSAVSTFESALREQSLRLAGFHHESYARVRAVERLDARTSTVVVISDRVRGVRLSEVLATAERQGLRIELNAALCLVRQLVTAVAALHDAAPDSCHGAIAPERIVITPEGRLVLVEYVLGPALEELRFSQERYWRELGIALPHTFGLPRFDLFADVTQVGAVSLALILGRRLRADEYPAKISDVVDNASTTLESGEQQPLPVLLRAWLRSALQLEPRHSFVSAVGAKRDLEIALSQASPDAERASLRAFLTKYGATVVADRAPWPAEVPAAAAPAAKASPSEARAPQPQAPPSVVDLFAAPAATSASTPSMQAPSPTAGPSVATVQIPEPTAQPAASTVAAPAVVRTAPPAPAAPPPPAASADRVSAPASRSADAEAEAAPRRPLWLNPWVGAAAALAIAATVGFTLLRPGAEAAPGASTGTLTVGTNPDGVEVFIDGVNRGTTPLNVTLPAGEHVLELVTPGERRRIPVALTAGGQVSQYFELPKNAAAGTGSLQIRTDPPRVRVTVDGVMAGRTPTVVNDLAPGPHQVLLESDTERVTEQVVIEAGVTASLVVPMQRPAAGAQSGWITVSVPAEVQVYENQRLIGTSRSERIMVSAGRHELELVNESLGFRATRSVDVASGQVAAVRPDWPRGSVALNALPWAEVFVDGERLGETPIGSAALPIGVHEIVFRHPDLGEKKANAIVTLGAPARLSVDMRAK